MRTSWIRSHAPALARRAALVVLAIPLLGVVSYELLGRAGAQDRAGPQPSAPPAPPAPLRPGAPRTPAEQAGLLAQGRYLAAIGVCAACHTPPDVSDSPPPAGDQAALARERRFRTDPDWFRYLDPSGRNHLAGGVPFILRLSRDVHGVVYARNITPDSVTGIGRWSEAQVVEAIRSGRRPDGTSLFLFAPHTFFRNLAEEDALALAVYLRSIPPVRHAVLDRSLPFPAQPATGVSTLRVAPQGRTPERAEYLLSAIVGCGECHSHTEGGQVREFTGGRPGDPFIGVFRLGPDLPLRQTDRGFSAFPYPGYALLYAPNLTRFGLGGDLSWVPADQLVDAIRRGVGPRPDAYGRPDLLAHVMLWQFYAVMRDDDAYALAEYVKSLRYVPNQAPHGVQLYGTDWEAAFRDAFGEAPSDADRRAFGKTR
jgi:cytochrome c553